LIFAFAGDGRSSISSVDPGTPKSILKSTPDLQSFSPANGNGTIGKSVRFSNGLRPFPAALPCVSPFDAIYLLVSFCCTTRLLFLRSPFYAELLRASPFRPALGIRTRFAASFQMPYSHMADVFSRPRRERV
jgi:hypothetical protein